MDEFELALHFKGNDILLPVRLVNYATSYKLEVEIEKVKALLNPMKKGTGGR